MITKKAAVFYAALNPFQNGGIKYAKIQNNNEAKGQ